MDAATLGALVVLALVDSTSVGTLLIPLWMMLAARVPARRIVLFLATVAVFYFAVGVLLLAGAVSVSGVVDVLAQSPWVRAVQVMVGAGLIVLSFVLERRRLRGDSRRPGLSPWQRITDDGDALSPGRTVLLGLGATTLEVATMLPYLAAIGLLSRSGVGASVQVGVLAGYVVVMVAPAGLALVIRWAARRRVDPLLERLAAFVGRHAASLTEWVVGIVGFLVLLDAVQYFAAPLLQGVNGSGSG